MAAWPPVSASTGMSLAIAGSDEAPEAAAPAIRRLNAKGDQAVLTQLLALEKRLFKKADNWGDLLIKETQRRNTFLLYAQAPSGSDGTAAPSQQQPPAAGSKAQQRQGPPRPHPHHPQPPPPVVVGYIVYTATGLNAHISKLAVAPDWRRRGVARALVREVVRCARCERRVSSLSLHVDVDNAPALGLYRGEGFESEALLEDYYCRGRHAHKMRLELDA